MAIELLTNIALEATPVAPSHVINIRYLEEYITGKIKSPVRVAATAPLAATYIPATQMLRYSAVGQIVIDNITIAVGDRVLVAGQANQAHNGIYVCQLSSAGTQGELVRADDFDEGSKIFDGLSVSVNDGDVYSGRTFKLITTEPVVLDTTTLEWVLQVPSEIVTKFAADIDADGTATQWTITHGLNTDDVTVEIWNRVTKSLVMADVEVPDDATVVVKAAFAPPNTARYRVIIIG